MGENDIFCIIHKDFQTKMTSFSFFKYFDAFELDVNVVNFVYYGKTRFVIQHTANPSLDNEKS